MLGGISKKAQIATPDVSKLVAAHAGEISGKLGIGQTSFDAITYKTQLVNGTNYFIKIRSDSDVYHVKIHKAIPAMGGMTQFLGAEGGHSLGSEIKFM